MDVVEMAKLIGKTYGTPNQQKAFSLVGMQLMMDFEAKAQFASALQTYTTLSSSDIQFVTTALDL